MLRSVASTVARRATLTSSRGVPSVAAPHAMTFHSSVRREEESKEVEAPKGGIFGTGLSNWYALPIGMTAAVPLINFDLYVINEETQLAAVFVAFCVAVYTSGGDAIYKSLDERAQVILKEHNEAEDKVIAALEQKLDFLKANQNMVQDFESINSIREDAYVKLNAAGAIKPKHDFKLQVERVLGMVATEEASVAEKTKVALMSEATAAVTEAFVGSKQLKKSALDAAIATIKGDDKKSAADPVKDEFVNFFKAKAAAAKKADDGSEEAAQRAALIAKMNAVCKTEGFFFEFDADGKPKMTV
mmetsp:Transcript_23083/g.32513  ORF Transcript_23083/g.32513 Transcript_23083/m.32513 type:complete len:302 (-) Transcript_23083:181-1086(-)|eukprot:CAMPEP_0184862756 /NCGR_PEP_ID=MMETSP0580-20130426/7601_1 /TAXON_ID=1118495 /ORGANISM="Dactyliosolen fragilissimus" /LENGTH=301 /DNA_ID=CAMNT_0027360735 /DNA_START=35 /DNA_END=940 /DNA_ORIENTATION=+